MCYSMYIVYMNTRIAIYNINLNNTNIKKKWQLIIIHQVLFMII